MIAKDSSSSREAAMERVLQRLGNVDECNGGYKARCPAHDDTRPSLSINYGDKGVVLKCHTGCETPAIMQALGMEMQELFYDSREPDHSNGHSNGFKLNGTPKRTAKQTKEYETPAEALESAARGVGRSGEIAEKKSYSYWTEQGEPFGLAIRFDMADGSKEFRQCSRTDGGQWVLSAGDKLWPLYQLAELPPDCTVYVHEGEKACDAGIAAGLHSVTSKGGCEAAKKSDWSPLAGRDVVIFPDNDAAGEKYARDVIGLLGQLVPAARVRVVRLPGLPDKGDFYDFAAQAGDDILERVDDLVAAADVVEQPAVSAASHGEANSTGLQWQPFPVEVLPGDLGEYVEQSATFVGVDPAMVALPFLSALATGIGGQRDVEIHPGYTEPLILWSMCIADSGRRKSAGIGAGTKHLEAYEASLEGHNEGRRIDHQRRVHAYEAELSAWKSRHREASKRGDKLGNDHPPIKPDEWYPECVLVDDTTTEALTTILKNNPAGCLLAQEELSSWLQSFERYNSKGDEGRWLKLYDGKAVRTDRKGEKRAVVTRPRLSVAGGIQPAILGEIIGHKHQASGLIQRFMLAAPPWVKRPLRTPPVNWAVDAAISGMFERMRAAHEATYRLTPDAYDLFSKYFDQIQDRVGETAGSLSGFISKQSGGAVRMAAILHAGQNHLPSGKDSLDIGVESMQAAIVLSLWLIDEWQRIQTQYLKPGEDADLVLLQFLEKNGGKVERREIVRHVKRYQRADVLDAALARYGKAKVLTTYSETCRETGRKREVVELLDR